MTDKQIAAFARSDARRAAHGLPPVRPDSPLPMRGLGDLIAKATTAIGIRPCGGCKKKQEFLNKWVPFT